MSIFSSRAVHAGLLSLSLGVFVASANAQQARFTLPYEAHWGNAVLQPGDYTLSTSTAMAWPKVLTISGEGKTVYLLASVEALAPESQNSYLRIAKVGETHVIEEFRSGLTGKSFLFAAPKTMREQMAARGHSQEITDMTVIARH